MLRLIADFVTIVVEAQGGKMERVSSRQELAHEPQNAHGQCVTRIGAQPMIALIMSLNAALG